jgi:transposase-like protein
MVMTPLCPRCHTLMSKITVFMSKTLDMYIYQWKCYDCNYQEETREPINPKIIAP